MNCLRSVGFALRTLEVTPANGELAEVATRRGKGQKKKKKEKEAERERVKVLSILSLSV